MLKTLSTRIATFALVILSASSVFAVGDEPPAWLRSAAMQSAPGYDKEVPGVVLLNEQRVTVTASGETMTTTMYAVRLLNRNGRGAAHAAEAYNTDASKIREMRAWLIKPGGNVKRYGKSEALDIAQASAGGGYYSESRVRVIDAEDDAETGDVFGYEVTTEDKSFFTQFEWRFQGGIGAFNGRMPALASRFILTLPVDWRAESVTLNHEKLAPVVNGSTYTWELKNLAPIDPEPMSPEVSALAPRIGVSYFPAAGKQLAGGTFTNWSDASRWLTTLMDAQSTPDEAIAAKARALTANAKTEFERIALISRYVQNIQYVAISLNVGRGGGYRPRSASEVFAKSYGDCKDKANLMRAMLKTVGITSYLMPVYSGDRTYVREIFPSPQQFNHCIIAVKVADDTKAATIVMHPTLGRLLIFDPTDETTLLGDLPDHEQDSFALVVAGEQGALLRLPSTTPEANQTERVINAQLDVNGGLAVKVQETAHGQDASQFRRQLRDMPKADYQTMIERWITRGATGASAPTFSPSDDPAANRFQLNVDFNAPSYAQSMQGRLLVFKPVILSRRTSSYFSESKRKHPIVLDAQAFTETVNIKIPAGFIIDELPDKLELVAPFGSYITSYDVKDDQLTFTRRLVVRAMTIPASDYEKVRNFYGRILAAEQSPAVLAKK